MPEIGWAGAFALGSIVSPTDPVASSSVAHRLGLPRRLLAILEGEGLVNDAVALTLLSLAAAALQSHSFSIGTAAGRFTLIVVGETAYGLAVGWVAACIRQRLRDSRLDASVSLITPFVAYLVPQSLGGSGVLAVVAAGMYIGIRAPEMLTAEGRLSLAGSWNVVTFLLNGALFLLTGLQFRSVINGTTGFAAHRALLYGAAVTLAVVVIRFVWTWPASWATERFSSGSSRGSRLPDRQVAFLGWCGMRGGISLAAALSLPAQVPERSLIVFVTACVIAGTLIVQGAPLPLILRALRLDRDAAREATESLESERRARTAGIQAALAALDGRGSSVESLREEYNHRLELLRRGSPEDSGIGPAGYRHERLRIGLEALSAERGAIIGLYRKGSLPEYVLHRIERDLDLREVRLRRLLPE
jgi:CPA1 family monovalent cation:H+ antiporter